MKNRGAPGSAQKVAVVAKMGLGVVYVDFYVCHPSSSSSSRKCGASKIIKNSKMTKKCTKRPKRYTHRGAHVHLLVIMKNRGTPGSARKVAVVAKKDPGVVYVDFYGCHPSSDHLQVEDEHGKAPPRECR